MNYAEFVKAVKAQGTKVLLRDVTEYKDLAQADLLYAENASGLIGVYGKLNGGLVYAKPKRLWSKARRKFEKVKI